MKKIKDIIDMYISGKLTPGDNIIYDSCVLKESESNCSDLKYIAADSESFKKVPLILISPNTDEINYLSEKKKENKELYNLIDYNISVASYYIFSYGADNYFKKNYLIENSRTVNRPTLNSINQNQYFDIVSFFSERYMQISNIDNPDDYVRIGPTTNLVSVRGLKKIFITDKFQRTYITKKNNKFIMNIFLLF